MKTSCVYTNNDKMCTVKLSWYEDTDMGCLCFCVSISGSMCVNPWMVNLFIVDYWMAQWLVYLAVRREVPGSNLTRDEVFTLACNRIIYFGVELYVCSSISFDNV